MSYARPNYHKNIHTDLTIQCTLCSMCPGCTNPNNMKPLNNGMVKVWNTANNSWFIMSAEKAKELYGY